MQTASSTSGQSNEEGRLSQSRGTSPDFQSQAPKISLPKGGGAIRGLGEKFAVNPATGTASLTLSLPVSPGRSGFGPQLSLSYDSGTGNGPFGFGWSLAIPSITRKTDKGMPRYVDGDESDVFLISGAEDLVPVLIQQGDQWKRDAFICNVDGVEYQVQRYRPRIEGLFARIERWTRRDTGETHWRSISPDNVTTFYGRTPESRIADPSDPLRVFTWLMCESYDDRGNALLYRYQAEDSKDIDLSQLHERNRTPESRVANRYLKQIFYANRTPRQAGEDLALRTDWMFEIIFDYDEGHYDILPKDAEGREFVHAHRNKTHPWSVRKDPFSSFRAGFEVRTYRLCRRVLLFHHFPDELGIDDYLTRSTELTYEETPIGTFLTAVCQPGYRRMNDGRYLLESLPPIELEYSKAIVDPSVREVDAESLENMPEGLEGSREHWIDLDGEGLFGILMQTPDAWYYKHNLGKGRFGPLQRVATQPAIKVGSVAGAGPQFLDLSGDGQLDVAQMELPTPGFFERTLHFDWSPFKPFLSFAALSSVNPNLRFVDLTGDGLADALISEDQGFRWHPSYGEKGFGPPATIPRADDEEKGPHLVFADGSQSIYLADMSGDGLHDLVRIRNGEVCYWPNLGYGRFGAKIAMDRAPWFDEPDAFDQKRIRLADIDGSGVTDIIYLSNDGPRLYFNQSGNTWSEATIQSEFPRLDNVTGVTVADLCGRGTACLVWSSPLPADAHRHVRYVDLMSQGKPHLLIAMRNNRGAETRIHYAPSTRFYLEDKENGKPWTTRLPFAVQVVERVEVFDWVSRNRFVTRYAYHHGCFDGSEREFRGFGMVEQFDTEEFITFAESDAFPSAANLDTASHVPPVLTRTWFHTGMYVEGEEISRVYAQEYYKEGDESLGEAGLTEAQLAVMQLADTILPADGSVEESREACRALKGSMLRQEIYARDGTEEEDRPYRVSEKNYTVRMLQPHGPNRHAVFLTHDRESIDFHYDRKLYDINGKKMCDPRVSHILVLKVDDFGNKLLSTVIAYGRRHAASDPALTPEDKQNQKRILITAHENLYTNPILDQDAYRTPRPCAKSIYEILNVVPAANEPNVTNLFRFDEILARIQEAGDGLHEVPYEDVDATTATAPQAYRRLIERTRTLYRKNDLSGALPMGQIQSRALPFESYALALTPGILTTAFGNRVTAAMLSTEGGYLNLDGDGNQWLPSGRILYSPNKADTPSQEAAFASQHFFLPHRFCDSFSNATKIRYDAYNLLLLEVEDPLANKLTAGDRDADGNITSANDYRVLKPQRVTDPNGNRSAVAYDALGLVTGMALMGKTNENIGDSLAGFEPDLSVQQIEQFFSDPRGPIAQTLLSAATTRTIYDLSRFQRSGATHNPIYAATIARETHVSDMTGDQQVPHQTSFSYSDGFEREIQGKLQAEAGPLTGGGPIANLRWIGSGWTIFNNKGKPVRQYEPFFSNTHDFELAKQVGVSPIVFYDPLERIVAALNPNHTWLKSVFDPWQLTSWDVNDNILQTDPVNDPDVGNFFQRLSSTAYLPTWHTQRAGGALGAAEQAAAVKTAAHANTPTLAYFDTMGRGFLAIANNGDKGQYATRVKLDSEGNQCEVRDAKDRVVVRSQFDLLGNRIHHVSMEAPERRTLYDAIGKPIRSWDSRGFARRVTYDALRRPTHLHVSEHGASEILAERQVYGDTPGNGLSDAQILAGNLRGKLYQQFDSSGVVTNESFDFKGNQIHSSRRLARDYKTPPDWSTNPTLEMETFVTSQRHDALNRMIQIVAPHTDLPATPIHVIQPKYNEANMLEQVNVWLQQNTEPTGLLVTAPTHQLVTNIDYDEKGRRTRIHYGNGVTSEHEFDPVTFRMTRLSTKRGQDGSMLQDLRYTYDAGGRMTRLEDAAQQTVYFNNAVVGADAEYTYDAIYRLIAAAGREHIGQVAAPQITRDDGPRIRQAHPHDGQAMRRYTQTYDYDETGNLLLISHQATAANWTRGFTYGEPSLIEAGRMNNRLSSSTSGSTPETFTYDAHGNITSMLHLSQIGYDFKDHIQFADLGGGKVYYGYDATGQRVRKVWEKSAGLREERIYLGDFEIFRKWVHQTLSLERQTLHAMDDRKRIAMIELRTVGIDVSPTKLVRYQLANHMGSAALELDATGQIISYEEYYPYGSTSYQAVGGQTETSKRHRYSGKERDEETGLYFYGTRYYAPWLCRWISCDPLGLSDSVNPYEFVRDNPISFIDPDGGAPTSSLNGEVGELIAQQFLDERGLHVFTNWEKHVNHNGFDFVAYNPKTDKVWMIDNKSYQGTISEATSLSPANYSNNLSEAKKFLQNNVSKEGRAALAALEKGNIEKVVINAYSKGNAGFSPKLFTGGIKAFDVRTGKLFSSHNEWIAEMRAAGFLKGRRWSSRDRILGSRRGFATVGGMLFTIVAIGATVYVISQSNDKTQAMIETGVEFAIAGLVYRVAGGVGFIALSTLTLCSDNAKMQEECERKDIVMAFLRKHVPQAVTREYVLGPLYYEKADPTMYQEAYDLLFNTKPIEIQPSRPVSAPGGMTGYTPAPAARVWRANEPPPPELFEKLKKK